MLMPKISIVMPVLNREDTLEKALLSVINQSYSNWELIILDGGSTDKTLDIIQRYETLIAYWHTQKDGSAAAATNMGIEKASGDLIALLMADDWYEPETFAKIASAFHLNPSADMLTCTGRIVSLDANATGYATEVEFTSMRQLSLNFYNICFGVSAICFRFIRKSFYDQIGLYIPFDSAGKQVLTNDKEFLMRAVLANANDVFVNHLGYTYLAHAQSYSFGDSRVNAMRHCAEHMDIAEHYLTEKPLSFKHKCLLKYWRCNQATKLILFHWLDKDFLAAKMTWKKMSGKFNFLWPIIFLITAVQVSMKRSYKRLCIFFH